MIHLFTAHETTEHNAVMLLGKYQYTWYRGVTSMGNENKTLKSIHMKTKLL